MKPILIKTIDLENHLTLDIYDESIKTIGDRWMVNMVARIKVPLDEALIQKSEDFSANKDKIKKALGKEVVFEHKSNRIFVDDNEKESIFQEMYDHFIDNTLHYLSRPNFPERFLLKKIREEMKRQLLQK
jgi:hypothetical protein